MTTPAKTETPLTDAEELRLAKLGATELATWTPFARQLERELTQWREVAGRLAKALEWIAQHSVYAEPDTASNVAAHALKEYDALAKLSGKPTAKAIVRTTDECFELCVKRIDGPRTYQIKCRIGLWSVAGSAKEDVEKDARRYWLQYFEDGEYHKLLKSLSDGGKG